MSGNCIEFPASPRRRQSPDRLTPRERQVVELAHLRNQDIATELGVSIATVKTLIGRALEKTGAENRTHLYALVTERAAA